MHPNSNARCYRKPIFRSSCLMLSAILLIALVGLQPLTANAETLTLIKPNGGEIMFVGSTYTAEWTGNAGKEVYVYVSVTEPYQYYLGSSSTSKFTFTVPDHSTTQAKVQIAGVGIGNDISDNFFTIKKGLQLEESFPIYPIEPIPVYPIYPINFSPAAPTNLSRTASADVISLSWQDNATNETAFEIERRLEGGTFGKIGEVAADITTYEDYDVTLGTTYTYRVRAVNSYGNSDYSNTVSGSPLLITGSTGPFPANLTAQPLSASEIQLNWEDLTMGNDVFHIERNGVEIATVMDADETYRDTGLEPDTIYTYRLRMELSPQDPRYSAEASAKTLAAAAPPPVVPVEPPVTSDEETIIIYFDINSTNYYVNGERRTMDAAPVIFEGRTVLPIKYVAEPLGAAVEWDPGPRRVRITHQNRIIDLWIGQNRAQVNGAGALIDPSNDRVTPVVLPPGRTMLPLKFIATQLGALVEWDPAMRRVTITYQASQP